MKMKTVSVQQSVKVHTENLIPSAHNRLCAVLGFSLCMSASGLASAASVWIDDLADTIYAGTDVPGALVQITNEAVGILGGADFHFEYLSNDPNRPEPGMAFITNYNIFSPLPINYNLYGPASPFMQRVSDTLSITVSGHAHVGGPSDLNNVSVDIHFRSDSGDEIPPPALVNAFDIFETGHYQAVNSGLSDLIVEFRSDVSEVPVPAAAWLLGSGLLGLAGVARRRLIEV